MYSSAAPATAVTTNGPPRSLKRFVRYCLRNPSSVGQLARFLYRAYHRLIVEYYAWANTRKNRSALHLDPFQIQSANPAKIIHWVIGMHEVPRIAWRKMGSVQDGDWDKMLGVFAELDSYVGLCDHFLDGKPWPETVLYKATAERLATGTVEWGCLTVEQFAQRCSEIDVLYDLIRTSGYRSQQELFAAGRKLDPITHIQLDAKLRVLDEIAVCIARDGEFLFVDGQHRLSLAKILKLPYVPVRVVVRHAEWQRFREQLAEFIRLDLQGNVPHTVPHPDLNWEASLFNSAEWLQLIRDEIALESGTLLEVDAGISGYFASSFEQLGFECSALECNPAKAVWLEQIRNANQDRFEIMESLDPASCPRFDVVLWIGIADVNPEDFSHLVSKIAPLATAELYLACPIHDASTSSSVCPWSPHQIGEHLVERLGFSGYEVLELPSGGGYALIKATRLPADPRSKINAQQGRVARAGY